MTLVIYGGLILASLILQSTIFAIFRIQPDLILVLVVVFSLFNGPVFGAKLGFGAGLALDLLIGQLIGLNAVIKMLIGFLIGSVAQRFFKENYVVPLAAITAATLLDQALFIFGTSLFGLSLPWLAGLKQIILPIILYNALITLIVYLRLYYLNRKIAYWVELVKRSG